MEVGKACDSLWTLKMFSQQSKKAIYQFVNTKMEHLKYYCSAE